MLFARMLGFLALMLAAQAAQAIQTYTVLPNGPCRVADSRQISSPLTAATTRGIDVEDTSSYASQGGRGSTLGDGSTNCGIPSFATSYVVSLTVLPVDTGFGFFKIFENGRPYTEGNTVVYNQGLGFANDVIVKSCTSCSNELSVYSSTQVHYVIDIMGYFKSDPVALECVTTAKTDLTIAVSGTGNATAPACASGYTLTSLNCESSSWDMPFVYHSGGTCSAKNLGSSSAILSASGRCCRVP